MYTLAKMFDLPPSVVHSTISKMIINEELQVCDIVSLLIIIIIIIIIVISVLLLLVVVLLLSLSLLLLCKFSKSCSF